MLTRWFRRSATFAKHAAATCRGAMLRERDFIVSETLQLRGMFPLLARTRGAGLSPEERIALRAHLKRAGILSPYLVASIVPGSIVALPLIALWRGWRRPRH